MASKRDYYDILGISKNATEKEIKTAYRKLAMKYHPDVLKDGSSDAKMRELNEAYDTLSDVEKRKEYDLYGADGPGAGGTAGRSSGSADSFFDSFMGFFNSAGFGSSFGGRTTSSRTTPGKGENVNSYVEISFIESMLGKQFEQKLKKYESCAACQGTGAKNGSSLRTCSECKGLKHVKIVEKGLFGTSEYTTICPKCKGNGKEIVEKCVICHGQKLLQKIKTVKFSITPGSQDNKIIKLVGYGKPGHNGGPAGDMHIRVKVRPHKYFKRDGLNLRLVLPVSFLDIVKESTLSIPTPFGVERVKMKQTYKSGTVLKLQGKGVRTKTSVGDLQIKLEVIMPDLTPGQMAEMARYLQNFNDSSNATFVKDVISTK